MAKKKTTKELRELVLKKLLAINNKPELPLTYSSLQALRMPELLETLRILRNPPRELKPGIERPKCPVTTPRYQSMPTYQHKKRMGEHLARYGLHLEYPNSCVISALEWLANAFEEAKRRGC